MRRVLAVVSLAAVACARPAVKPPTTARLPTPTVQVGACGEPGADGVMGASPSVERADRDLDGDGRPELLVVDRAMCTAEGNCYWNVFTPARAGECSRYAGTFAGAALEAMTSTGDDRMLDVRGYWNLRGGRLLLQEYRYRRDGYQLVEALLCKRSTDDRLECADSPR